ELLRRMAKDPIVFALANPVPEIYPEEAGPYARVIGTGRSDYPNQINNVLCFPGMFRGLLHCRASRVNVAIKLAAARAIAGCGPPPGAPPRPGAARSTPSGALPPAPRWGRGRPP